MYNNISNDAIAALKSEAITTTARITLTSDNTVIDGNNLQKITITDQCYDNGIIVGTAMCKEVEIELIDNNYNLADKEFFLEVGVALSDNIYEYIPFGNFIVKDYEKIISSGHYKVIAYDYMDKFNKTFEDTNTYQTPITLQQFYEYVATYFGVVIENQPNLPNSNFSITQKPYFEGMSGRVVLSRIAEMMGCFAKINRNNKLEMRLKNTTSEQFSRNEMNNLLERDDIFVPINVVSLRLSQIEGENVTKKDEVSVEEFGETILQISDNPFVYNESLRLLAIDDIFNQVNGFSYYPTTFNGKLIYLDTGDEVEVQDMNTATYYKTIILKQIINIPSTRNSKFENKAITSTGLEYQFTPEQVQINKRTEYLVDKENQIISSVVSTVTEQNTKIAQTQQTVNELNSKIQDIADITVQQETIYASLDFDSINESEPIEVIIHPITTNISYLYPMDTLYPSDTLYMPDRILRFTNLDEYIETIDSYYTSYKKYYSYANDDYTLLVAGTDYTVGNAISGTIYENKYIDYELPDDLLINPNTGTYDEFYLGYDEQICQVTKRCKYNADGSVSDLSSETINTYTYPSIFLTNGDYTVELLGYNNGYMSVRLMAQNIYTTQFATNAKLESEISQTATQIQTTVSATYETKQNAQTKYSQITQTANGIQTQVSENGRNISTLQQTASGLTVTVSDKVGKNEVISRINQSAESITINANKIGLTANNVLDIISGSSINLTSKNITIASNKFNVDKNGNITATGGTIGGFTINNYNLYGGQVGMCSTSGQNYAFWAGSSNSSEAPFRVAHDGTLRATNANITGTITATSGTFQNCTITNSCSVPASTVSGTLATNTIPNLNASKITSGIMSGDRVYGGTIGGCDIHAMTVSADAIGLNNEYESYAVGNYTGKSFQLIVQHEGQYWRRLTFKGGILVNIESSW